VKPTSVNIHPLPPSGAAGTTDPAEKWNNKALSRLLIPLIIEQLLALTMGAADTIMVSSVGEHAISGVNIIDNINNFFIIAFTALATGGAVVVSQYIGRQDSKSSRLAAKQLLYITVAVSLVITAFVLALRRPIIRALYGPVSDDVMDTALIYFLITALSYPFLAIYNACAALFRATGNSRVPMGIALMVNIINIGGNALFIYVFHMGAAGAALSTFLSRIAAGAVLLAMLVRNRRSPITLAGILAIKIVPPMTRNILNVGVPTGLENSMFQFGRLLTQRIFTGFGTTVIAANAVAGVINSFSFMPGMAYGMALLTVVGQCIGAGDRQAARRYTKKILTIAWLTIFVTSGLVYLFMEPLISLFSLSPEAHETAKTFLRVHCITMAAGWTFSFALPNALRAAGDARYVMIAAAVSMWTVRVGASYLLTFALGLGPVGVWVAMGGDFLVRGACYLHRWLSGTWEKMRVIDG
jgi:putative MATE family efflux protein